MTRRRLLGDATLAATAATLAGPAAADAARRAPPEFPRDIPIRRREFENWAGTLRARGLWTCRPRSPREALAVVRWAHRAGWTVRPRGAMHGWSPLAITPGTNRRSPVVLVDTTRLARIAVAPSSGTVRAGAGARLEALLTALQRHGLGLESVPATGDPTVGGAIAVAAHGAALPAVGEAVAPGAGFGSLSDLVLELQAIVWDAAAGRYVLRRFARSEPDGAVLATHLGRAFVTEVVLQAAPGQHLRCESHVDVPARELFAAPGSGGRTFEAFLAAAGRVEAIWFPFTEEPWLKVWTPAARKPAPSREVRGPYNYPFSDRIPERVAELARALVTGGPSSAPAFAGLQLQVVKAGLPATDAADLWGAAKDLHLYIRASTLRVDELGYAILTRRADVQRVLHLVAEEHRGRIAAAQAAGRFPVNCPIELRCCSLDQGVTGHRAPVLAPGAARPDRPEWDTAVYVNVLSLPGTPGWHEHAAGFERWLLRTFDGTWAGLRPEWSKAWALTPEGQARDPTLLRRTIPDLVAAGRGPGDTLPAAAARLRALDPHGVLSNEFLDDFLV